MANHFSALKRARQTEKKTTHNRANKSRLRSALRGLREAIASGDKAVAQKALSSTVSVVDKGVQKGILHKIGRIGFAPIILQYKTLYFYRNPFIQVL